MFELEWSRGRILGQRLLVDACGKTCDSDLRARNIVACAVIGDSATMAGLKTLQSEKILSDECKENRQMTQN